MGLRGFSGKRRNASEKPRSPTEGRMLSRRGVVTLLRRCPGSPREARLATTQNHSGQTVA